VQTKFDTTLWVRLLNFRSFLLNADFVSFPDQGSLTNNSWSDNLHPNTSFVKFFLEKSAKKVQFFVDFPYYLENLEHFVFDRVFFITSSRFICYDKQLGFKEYPKIYR
jgi:hypothetical protein